MNAPPKGRSGPALSATKRLAMRIARIELPTATDSEIAEWFGISRQAVNTLTKAKGLHRGDLEGQLALLRELWQRERRRSDPSVWEHALMKAQHMFHDAILNREWLHTFGTIRKRMP